MKILILIEKAVWTRRPILPLTVVLAFRVPLASSSKVTYCFSWQQWTAQCVMRGSELDSNVDVASGGNVEDKDGLSVLVNDYVGALIANVGRAFDGQQDV